MASQPVLAISAETRHSERKVSVLTPMANKDGTVDVHTFKVPSLSRAGTEYGGYSARHYSVKLYDSTVDFQCRELPKMPEYQLKVPPIMRTDTEQNTTYFSARSRVSTMESLVKRQGRSRIPIDEPVDEPKRVKWNL